MKEWIADTIKIQFRYRTNTGVLKNAKLTLNTIKSFGINYLPIKSRCFKKEFNGKNLSVRGFGYIITNQDNYYWKVDIKFIVKLKKLINLYGNYKINKKDKVFIELDNNKIISRVNYEYITKFEQYKRFKENKVKEVKRQYNKKNLDFWDNKKNQYGNK